MPEPSPQRRFATMTKGVIWKQLILFSIPLIIGNLFQQLYSTVDAVVVGRYVGKEALAAVGSSNSLINLIIGMFMGISTGAGVIVSQYYGARDGQKLSFAVHTCVALSLIGGVLLIVAGVLLSPLILGWMGTPDSVIVQSTVYLRIFFLGSLFNLVYNMGAGILRAVGDSLWPLVFLCVSTVVNTALDIAFVVGLRAGIAGAGYATVIAQGVSAALVMCLLMITKEDYRVTLSKIKVDRRMMGRILRLGIPSGVQQSIISLSNVVVQSNVNAFGPAAMAGYGTYVKIEGFVMLPLQSACIAATTFTGQNVGAGRVDRVKKGIFQGIALSAVYTAGISVFMLLAGVYIMRIFTDDESVVRFGYLTLKILLPFYLVISVHQILMGSIRGAGKSFVTMVIGIGNMCVLRMIYINLFVPHFPSFAAVMWGYPITWCTTVLMDIIYCWKAKWLPVTERKTE